MEELTFAAAGPASVRLGDMMTLPSGRSLSVRLSATLSENPFGASNLLVLGEMELAVLAAPTRLLLLQPSPTLPPGASSARRICSGVVAYWPPHLPAAVGARVEVEFAVLMMRATLDPLVTVTRGHDVTAFVLSGQEHPKKVRLTRLPRAKRTFDDTRVASTVATRVPAPVMDPARARPLPVRVPARRVGR